MSEEITFLNSVTQAFLMKSSLAKLLTIALGFVPYARKTWIVCNYESNLLIYY